MGKKSMDDGAMVKTWASNHDIDILIGPIGGKKGTYDLSIIEKERIVRALPWIKGLILAESKVARQ